MMLPVLRDLRQRDYELFSVHTLVDDSGFIMSFQIWKRHEPDQTRRVTPLEENNFPAVIDDTPETYQMI